MRKQLIFEITEESYKRAIAENSGACLVANAIAAQYPMFSDVSVDVATIRATDRKAGERYIWLTPTDVADTLLFFDQGWKEETLPKKLRVNTLAKVVLVRSSPARTQERAEQRVKRLAELEAKQQTGVTLTSDEKRNLSQLKKKRLSPVRVSSYGSPRIEGKGEKLIVRGGPPPRVVKHPNMLAGKHRHFGAKTAKAGAVFTQAVAQAVKAAVKKVSEA